MAKQKMALACCTTRDQYAKLFVSHVGDLAGSTRRVDIFRDFLEMASISIHNSTLPDPDREKRYEQIWRKHGDDKQAVERDFSYLLAITVEALQAECTDFLGHVYMSEEMAITQAGQFFTPSSVAKLLSKMNLGDAKGLLESSGKSYLTVNDPACGGGVMLVAAVEECLTQGLNPATQLCVYGEDIDTTCVYMTYIQMSLLAVPAIISHRNTISMETWSQWRTPIWMLHGFEFRERARSRREAEAEDADTIEADSPQDAPELAAPCADIAQPEPCAKRRVATCDIDLGQAVQHDLFAM